MVMTSGSTYVIGGAFGPRSRGGVVIVLARSAGFPAGGACDRAYCAHECSPRYAAAVFHVDPHRGDVRGQCRTSRAPHHKRELTALSPCPTPSSCRLLPSVSA